MSSNCTGASMSRSTEAVAGTSVMVPNTRSPASERGCTVAETGRVVMAVGDELDDVTNPPNCSSFWRLMLGPFIEGLKAAVQLQRTLRVFADSPVVLTRTFQCVALNGVFLLSMWVCHFWFLPAVHLLGTLFGIPEDTSLLESSSFRHLLGSVDSTVGFLFQALWFVPFYVVSLVLTTIWFQDIAEHSFEAHYKRKPASSAGIDAMISEEVYRLLVMLVLLLVVALCPLIPVVGTANGFILTCFIYSFYSFEYAWGLQQVHFITRTARLEANWLYFLGFGLPCTLAASLGSRFVNAAAYAIVFPFALILAVVSAPYLESVTPNYPPLPLFRLPTAVARLVLNGVRKWFKLPQIDRKQPLPAPLTAAVHTQQPQPQRSQYVVPSTPTVADSDTHMSAPAPAPMPAAVRHRYIPGSNKR